MTYTITVTEDATDEVVKQLTVEGSRKASKVYDGMSDRIDWERFSLNIDPALPEED
jgi:hypothetical protein